MFRKNKNKVIFLCLFFFLVNSFVFCPKASAIVGVDDGVVLTGEAIVALACATIVASDVYHDATTVQDFTSSEKGKEFCQKVKEMTFNANDFVFDKVKSAVTWSKTGLQKFFEKTEEYIINAPISYDGKVMTVCSQGQDGYVSFFPLNHSVYVTMTTDTGICVTELLDKINKGFSVYVGNVAGNQNESYVLLRSGDYSSSPRMSGGSLGYKVWTSEGFAKATYTFSDSICADGVFQRQNLEKLKNMPVAGEGSASVPLGRQSVGTGDFSGKDVLDVPSDYTPSMDTPSVFTPSRTWDLDVPSDTTGDITGEGTDEGTGEGVGSGILSILGKILKALLDILKFLLSMIKALVTALVTAFEKLLTKLFVPEATFFQNKFDGWKNIAMQKLGDNNLNFLKQSTSSKIQDIYVDLLGHHLCIVKLSIFENMKGSLYVWLKAFLYFLLLLFNFNKIIKLLKGSMFSDLDSRDTGGNKK